MDIHKMMKLAYGNKLYTLLEWFKQFKDWQQSTDWILSNDAYVAQICNIACFYHLTVWEIAKEVNILLSFRYGIFARKL